MCDEGLPKKEVFGELQDGKSSQGGQKKCYEVTLKASQKDFNNPTESLEQAAQNGTLWFWLYRKEVVQYEDKRICKAERKCKEPKARAFGES